MNVFPTPFKGSNFHKYQFLNKKKLHKSSVKTEGKKTTQQLKLVSSPQEPSQDLDICKCSPTFTETSCCTIPNQIHQEPILSEWKVIVLDIHFKHFSLDLI